MPSPAQPCVHELGDTERQQVIDYVFGERAHLAAAKSHWSRAVRERRSVFAFAGYRWNTQFVSTLLRELEKPEPKQEA